MAEYSEMRVLEVWYAGIEMGQVLALVRDRDAKERHKKVVAKARERSVVEHDFPKLAAMAGASPKIKDNPPLIYHPQDVAVEDLLTRARTAFAEYRESVQEDRRVLLDRYDFKDIAIKVVGVGSVGTMCAVILMMASAEDPLFLQVKEARASVLEPYAGASLHPNRGQRVVNGIRLMQSASDIFLGWTKGQQARHFYVRQLRDMKMGPLVELFTPGVMTDYATLCGWSLARAHARSGSPAQITGYLGKSDTFDEAIADFSIAYADQTERDHEVLIKAARSGRLEVVTEPD
jgi:ribosomal protein S9